MSEANTRTVIILPPEREDDILALARQWTRAWLIRPAIWLRSSDLVNDDSISPQAPVRALATVIARNGSASVELFEELGRESYDLLRFVAVRSVEVDSGVNHELDQAIDVLRRHLEASKPAKTRIQYVNLILAPTNQQGGSRPHLVEMGWNMNVVVSPENRPTAQSFDAFSRHSDGKRWAGFVLSHLVTAAGLWATIPAGPYDDAYVDDFQEGVHLQRLSVRGVLTGSLVVSVALSAMELARQDESPLADPLIAVDEDDLRVMTPTEQMEALGEVVRLVLEANDRQLSYRPPASPPGLTRRRIGFFAQMRDVAGFGWDKFVDSPRWVIRKFKGRASRRATERLHGEEGDTQVDVGGILSWEDAAFVNESKRVDDRRAQIVQAFDQPIPALRYDVNARLWEGVREACFALLDGSPLPADSSLPSRLKTSAVPSIVASVSAVLPDWRDTWEPPPEVAAEMARSHRLPDEPLTWLDISFTEDWATEIDKRVARLHTRESTLRERLGQISGEYAAVAEELFDRADELISAETEVEWLQSDLEEFQVLSRLDDSSGAVVRSGEGT